MAIVDADEAKPISVTSNSAENGTKHNADEGRACAISDVDYKDPHAMAVDLGSGTLEDLTEWTPECPHCADKLYLRETGGIGSGSVTIRSLTVTYYGTTKALSKEGEGIIPIAKTLSLHTLLQEA